ncbi:MAG: dephospho-CoA kinase [Lachnospiraceae bacterium]|nr:dephospho-CoA kinase [Lachnospiraceae bacterium]
MIFIGITGGVGAGKSAILTYMKEHYRCRVMLADEIAHDLMRPGSVCYGRLQILFGAEDIWQADGTFDRAKLAAVLFSDKQKRESLNLIVHPAVKLYVAEQYEMEREKDRLDFLVLEAALLIEEKYDAICDELWYIYTSEENRRTRLKQNRGYSDEKIDSIFESQLSEETFRAHCAEVIDNNGMPEDAFRQIEAVLKRRRVFRTEGTVLKSELYGGITDELNCRDNSME